MSRLSSTAYSNGSCLAIGSMNPRTIIAAAAMIVRGFIEPIAKQLPLEYAVELNRLIELEMEGSVG